MSADTPSPPPADHGSLDPHRQIQKYLISTTGRLAGEDYVSAGLIAREAYPGLRHRAAYLKRTAPGGRTVVTLSFRTPADDHGGFIIPNYDHTAEMMCGYLAVLYGKRFDNHGAIEGSGHYYLPDLRPLDAVVDPDLPFHHDRARSDFPVALSLSEIARLEPLMFGEAGRSQDASIFRNATKFYLRALQTVEQDVEIAYLHLITCGEILSSAAGISADQMLDAQTRHLLSRIETEMADGAAVARSVRGKLRSIRRRFIWTFANLTDEAFFTRSEAQHAYASLRGAGYLKTLGAAYDLRSRYVHTGKGFGDLVAPRGQDAAEVQTGRPVVDDKAFGKILADAPTFAGLERLVRYGLLSFAQDRLAIDLAARPAPTR